MMLIIANSVGVEGSRFRSVPNEVRILPVGKVESQKGDFYVDHESYLLMKADMESHGVDIVVDYEHQTLKDCEAPAGGWVKKLEYTPDAITAKVEWTPRARQYLSDKEYRYLSPVVLTRREDRKAVRIHSLALTNTPAIDNMFPIVNSTGLPDEDNGEGQTPPEGIDIRKLIKLLGLPEDATAGEVMQELTRRLSANDIQAHKMEVERLLDDGLRDGKILSYQVDDMRTFAEADLKGFKAFINKAPRIVPIGKLDLISPPGRRNENEKDICRTLGLPMEDYEKYSSLEI